MTSQKSFKIIGFGKFGKALYKTISQAGGIFSEASYDWLIPAVPSTAVKEVILKEIQNKEKNKQSIQNINILIVSKGMSEGKFLSELLEEMHLNYAVLAGPHLAAEIELGLPTRSTIASQNADHFAQLQQYFPNADFLANPHLLSLASVFKNIAAFVCGMSDELGLGNNARACIIQEAMNQLSKLAFLLGFSTSISAQELLRPGILGDLLLTCTSPNSRNFSAGKALIRGEKVDFLIESAHSAKILLETIKNKDINNEKQKKFSIIKIAAISYTIDINKLKQMIILLIDKK